MSIEVTYVYKLERLDTPNFHGWAVFECAGALETEYFKSSSRAECEAVLRDLRA